MADVLVVLEQRDDVVKRVSYETLGAARVLAGALGGAVHALVIGPDSVQADAPGAAKLFHAAAADVEHYQPDEYAAAVARQAGAGYAAVLLPATALGKDLAPRVAAKLGCPLVADVTELRHDGAIIVKRPVYAGKALCTIKITATPCVVSLRPNVFPPSEGATPDTEQVDVPAEDPAAGKAHTVEVKQPEKIRPDVAESSIVVSGGRGLKGPEHFAMIEALADALGGAVGASRAAVDAGWRPHAEQVGQTGKTVSPSLYIAIGISGAVQHLAGMRTAKTIVAINKDKDAPIFKVADYGIVGDAFEIVPKLTEAVKQLKEG